MLALTILVADPPHARRKKRSEKNHCTSALLSLPTTLVTLSREQGGSFWTEGERGFKLQELMASRKGYTSLPADSSSNDAEQPAGAAAAAAGGGTNTGAEHSSVAVVGARGDAAASGRDSTSGSSATKKETSGAKTAAGKDTKADPTGAPLVLEKLLVAPSLQKLVLTAVAHTY